MLFRIRLMRLIIAFDAFDVLPALNLFRKKYKKYKSMRGTKNTKKTQNINWLPVSSTSISQSKKVGWWWCQGVWWDGVGLSYVDWIIRK